MAPNQPRQNSTGIFPLYSLNVIYTCGVLLFWLINIWGELASVNYSDISFSQRVLGAVLIAFTCVGWYFAIRPPAVRNLQIFLVVGYLALIAILAHWLLL